MNRSFIKRKWRGNWTFIFHGAIVMTENNIRRQKFRRYLYVCAATQGELCHNRGQVIFKNIMVLQVRLLDGYSNQVQNIKLSTFLWSRMRNKLKCVKYEGFSLEMLMGNANFICIKAAQCCILCCVKLNRLNWNRKSMEDR